MRILIVIFSVITFSATAQFSAYQSVETPFGARNAALGGQVVSLANGDLTQFVMNPGVLDSVKHNAVALNFSPYFAGIRMYSSAYQASFNKIGNLAFAVSYMDYGDFILTDPNGDPNGEFTADDITFVVGKSHRVGSFSLGANLKYAKSGIAGYGSSMVLGDLGGIYRVPNIDWTFGLVFKNFGVVFNDYSGNGRAEVPFDVLISTSIKPEHMPVRFSLSAFNLTEKQVYFEDEGEVSTSKSVEIADKIFRRINIGTEFVFHPRFQFLLGYNHLRRRELRLDGGAYGAGLSYGFMLAIKQFQLRYSHATYNAAGGTDFFTIQTNIGAFKKVL
ncbi:MAG: type IX secretion system protein PorQ [Marinoscillum sp.]